MAENLYRLMIVLRQPQANVVLLYASTENAARVYEAMCDQCSVAIPAADDFGNRVYIMRDQIAAVILTDIDRDMEGQKQLALKNARMQAKAQREAQADPMIGGARPIAMPANAGAAPWMRGQN